MSPPQSFSPTRCEFPHTDWSLVRAVQAADPQAQRDVLGRFLEQYLPAMRSYLIAKRYYRNDHDTDDLLSDFISDKIIASQLLDRVTRDGGRLRTYLAVCLDNFAKSKLRKRNPIGVSAVGGSADEPNHHEQRPDTWRGDVFDLEWAHAVLDRSIAMTRAECLRADRETSHKDQSHIWVVFESRLVLPMRGQLDEPVPFETLRSRLGASDTKQVQNWLVTGIRKFQRNITQVVGEYTPSQNQIRQEIGELFEILQNRSPHPYRSR